jgi:hypothetical protein
MEVSGHLYVPVDIPTGELPGTHRMGPRVGLDAVEKRKISLTGIEPPLIYGPVCCCCIERRMATNSVVLTFPPIRGCKCGSLGQPGAEIIENDA